MVVDHHFSDFTRENFRRLLRMGKRAYVARGFTDFSRDERFILWRHDIDFSMQAALRIARIEAEEGISATYFAYPHSQFYNLLERDNKRIVAELQSLGHRIGLHFDTKFNAVDSLAGLECALAGERAMLRQAFGVEVEVFSFHDTDEFTGTCREWTYAGMINAYAEYFQAQVGYVSDSNGIWRHRRLEEVLVASADERLQVLTHPAWWQDAPMAPRLRVERCLRGRAEATAAFYDRALSDQSRQNVRDDE